MIVTWRAEEAVQRLCEAEEWDADNAAFGRRFTAQDPCANAQVGAGFCAGHFPDPESNARRGCRQILAKHQLSALDSGFGK